MVVYNLVISVSVNSHVESVYQVSLLEDQPQVIYRQKHSLQVFIA